MSEDFKGLIEDPVVDRPGPPPEEEPWVVRAWHVNSLVEEVERNRSRDKATRQIAWREPFEEGFSEGEHLALPTPASNGFLRLTAETSQTIESEKDWGVQADLRETSLSFWVRVSEVRSFNLEIRLFSGETASAVVVTDQRVPGLVPQEWREVKLALESMPGNLDASAVEGIELQLFTASDSFTLDLAGLRAHRNTAPRGAVSVVIRGVPDVELQALLRGTGFSPTVIVTEEDLSDPSTVATLDLLVTEGWQVTAELPEGIKEATEEELIDALDELVGQIEDYEGSDITLYPEGFTDSSRKLVEQFFNGALVQTQSTPSSTLPLSNISRGAIQTYTDLHYGDSGEKVSQIEEGRHWGVFVYDMSTPLSPGVSSKAELLFQLFMELHNRDIDIVSVSQVLRQYSVEPGRSPKGHTVGPLYFGPTPPANRKLIWILTDGEGLSEIDGGWPDTVVWEGETDGGQPDTEDWEPFMGLEEIDGGQPDSFD